MIRTLRKIAKALVPHKSKQTLSNNGERVDILYRKKIAFDSFDMYQKSHYRRYEYARSLIAAESVIGDFACGTGYGSVMLAETASKVIGVDIDQEMIDAVRMRYKKVNNVKFICADLLGLNYQSFFDNIISFEIIEHFAEDDIFMLLDVFNQALKPGGQLIFSTPYMQEPSLKAIKMGFHLTFEIDEDKIQHWLAQSGFVLESIRYQNYETHIIVDWLAKKDFLICVSRKK